MERGPGVKNSTSKTIAALFQLLKMNATHSYEYLRDLLLTPPDALAWTQLQSYLKPVLTYLRRCRHNRAWQELLANHDTSPPMTVPLPKLENPAHITAEARARLQSILTERNRVEEEWKERLSDQLAVFNARTYMGDGLPFTNPSSANLDLHVFDVTCKLHVLHPHRCLLQLLQQQIAMSPTLSHSWQRYADLETIKHWRTTSALDVFEFSACIATICHQYNDTRYFVHGAFHSLPYAWHDMWRRTFRLDTVIGLPQHATAAQRTVAIVPAETLLGCAPTIDWIFASPQPCRAFWLIQPTNTLAQLQFLRARVVSHRSLATSVIVVCPSESIMNLGLRQWAVTAPWHCRVLAEGPIPRVPFLRSANDADTYTSSRDTHATVYWIVGGRDECVTVNDVVSNVGPFCRKNHLQFCHPGTTHCTPSVPKPALRDIFWQHWRSITERARETKGWTKRQWGTHLDRLNGLLGYAPQQWLRRLWNFVEKPVPTVLQEGTWIYVLWSPLTPYVYVGQTGAIRGTKMLLTRYLQHLRCGRSWNTLFGKKGVRGLGKLYPEMFKKGPHTFGITPGICIPCCRRFT